MITTSETDRKSGVVGHQWRVESALVMGVLGIMAIGIGAAFPGNAGERVHCDMFQVTCLTPTGFDDDVKILIAFLLPGGEPNIDRIRRVNACLGGGDNVMRHLAVRNNPRSIEIRRRALVCLRQQSTSVRPRATPRDSVRITAG